ncbi:MAG: hypothetical protein EPO23_07845 [Xanthobacteraceae bacterium]|nr:MAG: hypothetical protein EPO23_07845 [Xanthobacteraceae bacterium]
MRWELPRELLLALIFALAITVAALWPSKYPYGQAPQVNSQHQSKDGVGSQSTPHEVPPSPVQTTGEQQAEHGGKETSDVSFLGIKPGEWLLSLVTWMLWIATARLVRGADKTAEQQLRAYVSIESGGAFRQDKGMRFEFRPNVINNGCTPARDVRIVSNIEIVPSVIPGNFNYELPIQAGGSVSTIGPRQSRFHSVVLVRKLTKSELRQVVSGKHVFHIYGTVKYLDIFDKQRVTNFRAMFHLTYQFQP